MNKAVPKATHPCSFRHNRKATYRWGRTPGAGTNHANAALPLSDDLMREEPFSLEITRDSNSPPLTASFWGLNRIERFFF